MPRHRSYARNLSEYLALRAIATFVQCFDVDQNLRTAAGVGAAFFRTNGRRRERAERNIATSFPDWTAERVSKVARQSMEHMFQMFLVDAIVMPRLITTTTWPRHIRVGAIEPALERLMAKEPVIFVTGHCGNWEMLGYALSVMGYPVAALARPLDNPLINRWLLGIRENRGMEIITKWGAIDVLPRVLEAGRPLGFIADQNAGEQGLFVPFFGRLASSYKSIGLLAMRYEVPIIAAHARRVGGRLEYEMGCVDTIRPEDWVDQPDPLFYITARFNRAIEQMIRAAPEQYLWLHRRWKSRPRHERAGRKVPNNLIARLEALPWMTSDELKRIIALSNDPEHREVA